MTASLLFFLYLSLLLCIVGMLSGGVVGSLLGLNGGLMTWLLQYASGETVEERWQREYLHIRNTINAKVSEKIFRELFPIV